EIHYLERTIPVAYYIKNVNVQCASLQWDVDTTHVAYDFASGSGSGTVKGSVRFNRKNSNYDVHTTVSNFDLKVLEQYMKDFSTYGSFAAFMDADVQTTGSLNNKFDLMTSGKMTIRDFHFG